mmetsp:Transcript_15314/g.42360  ORF Transcript_15314/g.42360 Transcript_15314/m.42360 type:complete len:130 (-) Transcript_15314:555-944(-)
MILTGAPRYMHGCMCSGLIWLASLVIQRKSGKSHLESQAGSDAFFEVIVPKSELVRVEQHAHVALKQQNSHTYRKRMIIPTLDDSLSSYQYCAFQRVLLAVPHFFHYLLVVRTKRTRDFMDRNPPCLLG